MDLNKAFALIRQKLNIWVQEFIRMLPNLALAVLVLVIGFYLARIVKRLARKVIGRFSHGAVITDLFSSFIYILAIGVTIFIALSILQLDDAVTSLLAGAGIVGLALAFAFQDIAANFMSGILLFVRKPLRVGDIVELKSFMGKVHSIHLRDTVIETFQGQMVIIPNKDIVQNPIDNYSLLGKRRMDLTIGVSYAEDLERVRQVTLDAVSGIVGMSPEDKATFYYESFGDSAINFTIRIWASTVHQPDYLNVRSEAIISIKKAFDEHQITIPFPIRTLDFGMKGGKTLSDTAILIEQKEAEKGARQEAPVSAS